MANRTLPLRYAAQLQSLPRLFIGATAFNNAQDRHFALSALASIDSLDRNRRVKTYRPPPTPTRPIEDRTFQQMIMDSGVILGRDHTKWNYDIILELVKGPLTDAKRLDEAIRASKFVRRLTSFFQPYTNRFSSIKQTTVSRSLCPLTRQTKNGFTSAAP